jgi:YHS domain-containing protein
MNRNYLLAALWLLVPVFSSAEEAKPYPLKTCVVSDEKLGAMGKPVSLNYEGREVQFCCKSCIKDFNKNPKKFIAKLDDASKVK